MQPSPFPVLARPPPLVPVRPEGLRTLVKRPLLAVPGVGTVPQYLARSGPLLGLLPVLTRPPLAGFGRPSGFSTMAMSISLLWAWLCLFSVSAFALALGILSEPRSPLAPLRDC